MAAEHSRLERVCDDSPDVRAIIHPGDAPAVFRAVWTALTAGPHGAELQAAIDKVEREFGLSV